MQQYDVYVLHNNINLIKRGSMLQWEKKLFLKNEMMNAFK